jgi:hypothetical protein
MCVVLWGLLLAGCAHLEQAPLVYASKTTFGVDISSASTENPGISMNLGYKQVDAAYVPVAVARACREQATSGGSGSCAGTQYELKVISGSSKRGSSDKAAAGNGEAERTEQFIKAFRRYAEASSNANAAGKQVDGIEAEIGQLEKKWKSVSTQQADYEAAVARSKSLADSAKSAPTGTVAAEASAVADNGQDVQRLKLLPSETAFMAEYSDELKRLKEKRRLADEDYASKKIQVSALEAEMAAAKASISQNDRGDAYSVFGSFDGSSDADKDGASVGLGKMFSTGVASQNLSEATAIALCYKAAARLAEKLPQSELVEILKDCRERLASR